MEQRFSDSNAGLFTSQVLARRAGLIYLLGHNMKFLHLCPSVFCKFDQDVIGYKMMPINLW
jgi:hypothetical protein